MGGLSIWHWLVVLVIVVLVFGTKRLTGAGKDLGEAVKGFRKGLADEPDKPDPLLTDANKAQSSVDSTPTASTSDAVAKKDPTP